MALESAGLDVSCDAKFRASKKSEVDRFRSSDGGLQGTASSLLWGTFGKKSSKESTFWEKTSRNTGSLATGLGSFSWTIGKTAG